LVDFFFIISKLRIERRRMKKSSAIDSPTPTIPSYSDSIVNMSAQRQESTGVHSVLEKMEEIVMPLMNEPESYASPEDSYVPAKLYNSFAPALHLDTKLKTIYSVADIKL
jgi:hypothetical protein